VVVWLQLRFLFSCNSPLSELPFLLQAFSGLLLIKEADNDYLVVVNSLSASPHLLFQLIEIKDEVFLIYMCKGKLLNSTKLMKTILK
jgi:hypothetical protein